MVSSHHPLKEAFWRGNITFSREHKLNRLTILIYGALQILPLLAGLHIRLVDAVGSPGQLQCGLMRLLISGA